MWSSSKTVRVIVGLAGWLALLTATGCMSDNPTETDMPWSAPATWEGTIPLPSGFMGQHE